MDDTQIYHLRVVAETEEESIKVGPGQPCEGCSASVPKTYKYGTKIYHPAGRPCMKAESQVILGL